MAQSENARRVAGYIGIGGALLLFLGDMLLFGHFGSGAEFRAGMLETIQQASPARLFAGGLMGSVAGCMCIAGFWHVYQNMHSSAARSARPMFALFAVFAVAAGTFHALWTTNELALKFCTTDSASCKELLSSVRSYVNLTYLLSAVPGALASLVLLGLVLLKRTRYPRWSALANPLVLLALSPLAAFIPAPVGAVFVGGFASLLLVAFFVVSVATTWAARSDA